MPDALNESVIASKTTASAALECRVCNRRRIKCDGARPACGKCTSRGLRCPGYRKPLKWICGPASKGPNKLVFRTMPARQHSQAVDTSIVVPLVTQSYRLPTISYKHKKLPSLLSSTPMPCTESLLLQHFVDVVSVQLAWFNMEPNSWRSIVLPLAMESLGPSSSSYSLLAAILGVSASNVSSRLTKGDTQRDVYFHITDVLRTQAFRFLSADLRALRGALQLGTPPLPQLLVQTVIASVLLLSYLEIHWPSSGMWRFHLRAAQNISNMLHFASTSDATNAFLSEELFTASTWPLLTHCPWDETPATLESCSNNQSEQVIRGQSPFIAFIVIMRRVTKARREVTIRDADPVNRHAVLRKILQQELLKLEETHEMVLRESTKMCTMNGHDLKCMLSAYYYATQIYCHQTLSAAGPKLDQGPCARPDQATFFRLRAHLLDSLLSLNDPDSISQSQPWPLFILATLSTHDSVTQSWIETRMNCIMTLYCEIDRPQMLRFLKSFWGQVVYDNWIEYAQLWIESHGNFLIL